VRIPQHTFVKELLRELGEPLLSSTLILPGETEPMSEGWVIKDELDHVLDIVVEAGEVTSEPTTVIDYSSGTPEVVRHGSGDASRFE
jgi:tRNA A37 threonylcarbamoyladenosine synthetase subunit TsaC/SUA5/YrdC